MTQEPPAWLGTIRALDYRLPTPANTNTNLKSASTNEPPAYINLMRNGAVKVMETPLDELKANLRSTEVAAKRKVVLRRKILSASRKLGVKPRAQSRIRSASTANEVPAWIASLVGATRSMTIAAYLKYSRSRSVDIDPRFEPKQREEICRNQCDALALKIAKESRLHDPKTLVTIIHPDKKLLGDRS